MSVLDGLQTTEAITRFLRNKETKVTDIFTFITEKLFNQDDAEDDNNSIKLPQSEKFILELLIDRISQSNKLNEKFVYSEYTWILFNLVWKRCNNQDTRLSTMRSKVFANFKFGDIFTKILKGLKLNKIYENQIYIEQLVNFMKLLVGSIRIHLSNEQNVYLIQSLLSFIVEYQNYPLSLNESILFLISSIFKLNNTNSFSYEIKNKSEFSRSCLANMILVNNKYITNSVIKSDIKNILNKTLFSDNDEKSTVKFIEQFASVEYNQITLSETDILYLIKLLISKVDVNQLEDIIKILIKSYPIYSTILLKEITDMNKTLSVDFLSSLVESAIETNNEESINLIIHCIKRSSDVALKYSEKICILCTLNKNVNTINLFKKLFESYIKTREIDELVKLWRELIEKYPNSLFESDDIIDYASSKIVTFSYTQLSRLVENEVIKYKENPKNQPAFLLSVCKGLFRGVSGTIQNALSKTIIQNLNKLKPDLVSLLKIESNSGWKLRYYILNLFDVEDLEEQVDFILKQKAIDNDYYFYSICRIIEQDITKLNNDFIKKFKSYFNKISSKNFQKRIFMRWFMLIEILFEEKIIKSFVEKLIQGLDSSEIVDILQNNLIQTQPKITIQFIEYFMHHKEYYNYLQFVSIYAFNKVQKVNILDLMLKNIDEDYARDIIINILRVPTYKSLIESDFDSLIDLAEKRDEKLDKIIELVLNLHLKQPVESEKYILNAFNVVIKKIKGLSKKKFSKNQSYLSINLKLVTQSKNNNKFLDEKEKLISVSFEQISKLLVDTKSVETATIMIQFLTNMNFQLKKSIVPDGIKDIIGDLGLKYEDDKAFQNVLFGFICSFGGDVYKPQYIFALYIVLNGGIINQQYIKNYISKLSEKDEIKFIESWFSVCSSIKNYNSLDELNRYVELTSFFIGGVNKSENSNHVKLIHALFVNSISEIFTQIKERETDLNIFIFLECLKEVVSRKIWLFTQYSMELTLGMIVFISDNITGDNNDIYLQICLIFAGIVLYQRKRLSNRHHLIDSVLISLMRTLIVHSNKLGAECGLTFERLVSNVCEPNVSNISVRNKLEIENKDASINEALSQIKSGLRKYSGVLILNYLKFYLQYQISLEIKTHLNNSVYMILDLMTPNEMSYLNKSLDNQSRIVFRSLYGDYQKFYQWKEE